MECYGTAGRFCRAEMLLDPDSIVGCRSIYRQSRGRQIGQQSSHTKPDRTHLAGACTICAQCLQGIADIQNRLFNVEAITIDEGSFSILLRMSKLDTRLIPKQVGCQYHVTLLGVAVG